MTVAMVRWVAGITGRRAALIVAGLALAVAGLAVQTAGPASAGSSGRLASAADGVKAAWDISGVTDIIDQPCDDPGPQYYGGKSLQVYNSCSGRVWLHYDDSSNHQIYAFCVNPGGLAYGFSYPFADIQVTANKAPCDVGQKFSVSWVNSGGHLVNQSYDCQPSTQETVLSGFTAGQVITGCDFRIWAHVTDSGTGASACVDPNPAMVVDQGKKFPNIHEFYSVQQSPIEAPCSAGFPKYPY
jgi:hypothetical protein